MSCCGGGRSRGSMVLPRAGIAAPRQTRPTLAVFRYEGTQPITVIGRVTGARYRFAGPGAEVAVDLRDRDSVRQVPRLRELRLA